MGESIAVQMRADWIALAEVIHAAEPDETRWSEQIVEAARPLFPNADVVGFYSIVYSPDLSTLDVAIDVGSHATQLNAYWDAQIAANEATLATYQEVFASYHFTDQPVLTSKEVERNLGARNARVLRDLRSRVKLETDGIGIITHPTPGRLTVLHTMTQGKTICLSPHERQLLTRVALHLETAHRARSRPETVLAELAGDGRVLHRESDAPHANALEAFGRRMGEARSRRRRSHGDALELWTALLEGRASVAPRGVGSNTRYLVLENPPASRSLHALSKTESDVLSLAARGMSTKLIAYGLGLSSSVVSARLASAAAKIGVFTRAELVRLAAMLASDPRAELPHDALTDAERDVLALLQQGLSNHEIAKRRSRSVRTIANQVASLLRKTKSTSRRVLLVS